MRVLLALLFLTFLCAPRETPAQDSPEKPLEFEGFVLSDSLEYNAETIDYFFKDQKVVLNKNANITYLGRMLKSHTIMYYQEYEYMEALGKQDSLGVLVNTPTFSDRIGEELNGEEIKYSLKTQEGIVLRGRTTYDNGFLNAETIKRASDDTLFIANGTYSTCDLGHPHYYFQGDKMKFILNDKLIIKPITAYLYDIPVFWFPFYVFPIAQGRQSGFLTPRYGSSVLDGRYFSNIGYYLAPSDHVDYRVATTLREKNGWLMNNWFNYNKRYAMSGSLYGSYEAESARGTRQWKLSGSHRHTISPTLSVAGRLNMQSSKFSRNNSPNLYQRMNRNMNSSLRITKKWKQSGNSLIVYASNVKNLDTKRRTTVAPNLSFTMPKRLLFGTKKKGEKARKYTKKQAREAEDAGKKWYESIYYSFNADFKNTERDGTRFESVKNMNTRANLTSSNKFMGWLNINPSLSINEKFEASNDSIRYRRNDNISASLSLNTKVYGTFNPSIGRLKGLRHVITPSVSYRFGKRRDFSGRDVDVLYRFDENDNDKGRLSSMNVSLLNLFQAKLIDGNREQKLDLFRLDFRSGFDFEKEKQPLRPLTTTLDVAPSKVFKIRLTASHSFYHGDDFELFNPYLDNMSVTTTMGLSDRNMSFTRTSSRVDANRSLGKDAFETDIEDAAGEEPTGDGKKSAVPFTLRFTHYYRVARRTYTGMPDKYQESHTIKPNLTFSPTRNLKITYNLYYDIKNKSLNSHRLLLRRDLHCWEANLSWIPSGVREGFYFLVNIKHLPDVKIEKRRGVSRFSR